MFKARQSDCGDTGRSHVDHGNHLDRPPEQIVSNETTHGIFSFSLVTGASAAIHRHPYHFTYNRDGLLRRFLGRQDAIGYLRN